MDEKVYTFDNFDLDEEGIKDYLRQYLSNSDYIDPISKIESDRILRMLRSLPWYLQKTKETTAKYVDGKVLTDVDKVVEDIKSKQRKRILRWN